MGNRGPSPLVPFLMVGVLGLFISWPTLQSLAEYITPLFLGGDDEEGGLLSYAILLVPVLLLVLIHLINIFFPVRTYRAGNLQSGSYGYDDGYGVGTVLLIVLFLILYNVM